jgi:metallo-beta-lactamase class B
MVPKDKSGGCLAAPVPLVVPYLSMNPRLARLIEIATSALVIFLLTPSPSSAQVPSEPLAPEPLVLSEDLQVEPLGDGLWRHISYRVLEEFGRSAANGLVVVSDGEAALIDTPWTDTETARLLDWVEEELDAKVTVVIPTHSHPDCLGGLAEAHRRGARSYALARTVELARKAGAEVPQNAVDGFAEIRVGSRRLELHFIGPGHTEDDAVVWIPREKVLFGGCLVRAATSRHLGYTEEANLEEWPRTLRRMKQQYAEARRIVPGHGSPGGLELIDRTLELLSERDAP